MQGDFYRSAPKRRNLRSLLREVMKNRRKTLLILGGILVAVYLLFDNKGILKRISLEMQRNEIAAKVEDANKETQRLEAQKKALEGDKKTVEKLAREKYGMARSGETVYRVKKD